MKEVKAEYAAYPKPMAANSIPLMAPNMQSQVQQTIDQHPEIDSMNEEERGAIIDITDWRVNGNIETPWGRKARVNDPNNPQLNTDGMTYLRPDGLFEIYDCISGIDGNATWEGYGPYAPGENGYWWPPQPVEGGGTPTPPPAEDLEPRVEALELQVGTLNEQMTTVNGNISALFNQVDALTQKVDNPAPLHAHGPVDLPIVVESLTRMRAKGDIDVEVVEGAATPPNSSDEQLTVAEIVMLKRLLGSRPEEK